MTAVSNPVVGSVPPTPSTKDRVLRAALESFGTQGYDGTSLDRLAVGLGVSKQTILYHFGTKEGLMRAVVDQAGDDLIETFASVGGETGWPRIERLVRAVFRLALRRPELMGLLREISRPGSPSASQLADRLEPVVTQARGFLDAEMAAGRLRVTDSRLLMLSAYSTVVGVATEVEVQRAFGVEPNLRTAALRRRELLRFLRSALLTP